MSSNETSRGLRCIFEQSLRFFALVAVLGGFTGVLCAEDAQDVKPPPSGQTATPDPKSEEARKILEKARDKMKILKTYSADIIDSEGNEGGKTIKHYFFRNNPDGISEYRTETVFLKDEGNSKKIISIKNRNGMWRLSGKTAIRMVFAENEFKNALKEANSSVESNMEVIIPNFKLSDSIWDKTSCYVVTQTNKKEDLLYKIVYFIGKENLFLYREITYSSKGEIVDNRSYKNVEMNIPLDPNLFIIPNDYKIIRAEKTKDLLKILNGIGRE